MIDETNQDPEKNKHANELKQDLIDGGIIPLDAHIEIYQPVYGGADTTIFEIGFTDHPTRYIQRILRKVTSRASAEYEFSNQRTLYENGINVPETYLLKHPPNSYDRTYYVMKKIEGIGLNEILQQHPERFEDMTNRYILEMTRIHSIDPTLLPQLPRVDIKKNPYAVIDQSLSNIKSRIEKYPEDLAELSLVVDWLDKNKTKNPCYETVVIHGDYHPYNIIVDRQDNFHILDWTGINLSDFRRDLSFATTIFSAGIGKNFGSLFANKYEEFTGKKVENLEYFMILSNVWNLLRIYSGLNNPNINNENEDTLTFFKSVRDYPLLLVELVLEECGVQLKQIRHYFSK